jgi:hydroxyacylglutathione hydrolase
MILRRLTVGELQTNCYLVMCEHTREALVIDPGGDAPDIVAALAELQAQAQLIVLTHFHFDHMLAADEVRVSSRAVLAIESSEAGWLAEPPAPLRYWAAQATRGLQADRLLRDGEQLSIGDLRFEVLHTPGHSPGGISLSLATEGIVFCGDTLFLEGVGRTDLPGGDRDGLLASIRRRLFALPDGTRVCPGHGPETTIGHERQYNPWL